MVSIPVPTTKTFSVKAEADVLTDLQGLNTDVAITAYVAATKSVTFADVPTDEDVNKVLRYIRLQNDISPV
jgi:hypothetical protein